MEPLSLSTQIGRTDVQHMSNYIVSPSRHSTAPNTPRLSSSSVKNKEQQSPQQSPQLTQQQSPPKPFQTKTQTQLKVKLTAEQILDNPVTNQEPLKILSVTPEEIEAFRSMLQDFNQQFF
jgi:hypothetical protein